MRHWIIMAGLGALLVAARPVRPADDEGRVQIERGTALYAERCASCHGARMEGHDTAPPLHARAFVAEWTGRPVSELTRRIRTTMPQNDPGSLDAAETAAVTAAILSADNCHFEAVVLPETIAEQKALTIAQ